MLFRAAADIVVAVHAAFVLFVLLGGLFVVRWPRLVWVHVPAAAWGVFIELRGWICPLTPLENYLRQRGGSSAYEGDFIEHYLLPLLYPAHLARQHQIWLGAVTIIVNILLYWHVVRTSALMARGRSKGPGVLCGACFSARHGATAHVNGLDEDAVLEHRTRSRSILAFPGATSIPRSAEALELDCDVLIPAALENQLVADNAPRVKVKIILEGANGPTTPTADEIFRRKGTLIIPDIYANAGGVTVSYFEWLKNLSHVRFGRLERRLQAAAGLRLLQAMETATGKAFSDRERASLVQVSDELTIVNSGLEDTMTTAYQEIRETLRQRPALEDLRTAAFFMVIEKIARAYVELGIFP